MQTAVHAYMLACRHTCKPTDMHSYIHACNAHMHASIKAFMHAWMLRTHAQRCMHTWMQASIYTGMHACRHTHIHACMPACMLTNVHSYIHTCIHAYTNISACRHADMHACIRASAGIAQRKQFSWIMTYFVFILLWRSRRVIL